MSAQKEKFSEMKNVRLTYKNFFGIINKNKALAANYLLKSKAVNPWVTGSSPVFIFAGEVAQLEEQRKTILKVPSLDYTAVSFKGQDRGL